MKLHERLWKMARSDPPQAVSMSSPSHHKRIYVVPFGKYAGTWRYSTQSKHLSYSLGSIEPWNWSQKRPVRAVAEVDFDAALLDERVQHRVTLPHTFLDGEKYGRIMANAVTNKAWCLATWNWSRMKLEPFFELTRFFSDEQKQGIQIASRFCLPEFLAAMAENPERTRDIVKRLGEAEEFIVALGVRKRQTFIRRALRVGFKRSFRACFPLCPNRLLNSACEKPNGMMPGWLSEARAGEDDVPWAVYRSWRLFSVDPFGVSKTRYLNFGRRWPAQLGTLENYARELLPQVWWGREPPAAAQGWGPNDPVDPAELTRRHDVLSAFRLAEARERMAHLARDYPMILQLDPPTQWLNPPYAVPEPLGGPFYATQWHPIQDDWAYYNYPQANPEFLHRAAWAELGSKVPVFFTPLITQGQFQAEGAAMHHCVGGYADDISSMFAHVQLEKEKATVQIRDGKVDQLYGPCNQQVSEQMHNLVHAWVMNTFGFRHYIKPEPSGAARLGQLLHERMERQLMDQLDAPAPAE